MSAVLFTVCIYCYYCSLIIEDFYTMCNVHQCCTFQTDVMDNKLLCPTLSMMLVKTIKALCEINIHYDQKLEITGSLHVRSDGNKVCLDFQPYFKTVILLYSH